MYQAANHNKLKCSFTLITLVFALVLRGQEISVIEGTYVEYEAHTIKLFGLQNDRLNVYQFVDADTSYYFVSIMNEVIQRRDSRERVYFSDIQDLKNIVLELQMVVNDPGRIPEGGFLRYTMHTSNLLVDKEFKGNREKANQEKVKFWIHSVKRGEYFGLTLTLLDAQNLIDNSKKYFQRLE